MIWGTQASLSFSPAILTLCLWSKDTSYGSSQGRAKCYMQAKTPLESFLVSLASEFCLDLNGQTIPHNTVMCSKARKCSFFYLSTLVPNNIRLLIEENGYSVTNSLCYSPPLSYPAVLFFPKWGHTHLLLDGNTSTVSSSSRIQLKVQDFWVVSDLPTALVMVYCGLASHKLKETLLHR